MNQSTNTLGYFVRAARKRKHLSQEALAERIGVCKRTIIDIDSSGNPKFEKYIENGRKIAGVDPGKIITYVKGDQHGGFFK